MTASKRRALEALKHLPTVENLEMDQMDYWEDKNIDIKKILDGSEALNMSHAGGEFELLAQQMKSDILQRVKAFDKQLATLIDAYMEWCYKHKGSADHGLFRDYYQSNSEASEGAGSVKVKVVDIYYEVIWLPWQHLAPGYNAAFVHENLSGDGVLMGLGCSINIRMTG
ncbi:hypothetical protein SERLA73DRAFT_149229 [Serpula lacrymans var. lacrymans S7.3]|uniref:Uncharacterized protein n=2 Tax=Serpula lacrymans var. lacrymans TaxID=341189 RepID=F8PGT9_SERL3|nr:uncharacterized protein SERLADRAFT_432317 [Serpula lacrymans var. lacrymans S7.9]EGO04891.1 hypothetical protein SERLA73DRAFT_149229 [Serpula lacrymans var. lacrymans S7.3]EGO30707.1 hypothetical protein SERLADRAFT_432317 [Serpula lacrymans var. lacrymans S7.9]